MFGSNKVNHMTIIVVGVLEGNCNGRELMMEVIRRNCKMDYRLVNQMVYRMRDYESGKQRFSDYNVELEAYNMEGVVRDFELLKKAGVIKKVEKKQDKKYLVY